ncbi:hypothetical protein PanWU01x14_019330 [Parasponia andersonii]|uniref:Uncharacterized protein n=1 Tax=Parasponia andersonii TaxID=3476 RepID=A0A2P5DZE4_PARAD|nr:hypothetical protein PanWU01x14_019330 [Parasponia andersonii]
MKLKCRDHKILNLQLLCKFPQKLLVYHFNTILKLNANPDDLLIIVLASVELSSQIKFLIERQRNSKLKVATSIAEIGLLAPTLFAEVMKSEAAATSQRSC